MDEIYTYPQLAALKDKLTWDIPDNYFEELMPRILLRIEREPEIESYFESFFDRVKMRIDAESDELHTPILDAIPKDTIWEVPDGYFKDFEEKLIEKTEEETIAPLLFSLEKRQEFVPEAYFDALPSKIHAKISQLEKVKVIALYPNWTKRIRNYSIAIAASVALVFGAMWLIPDNLSSPQPDFEPNFSQISTEELEEALEDEILDDELLAEVLPVSYLTKEEKDLPQIDDISEEELMRYLEKEGEL